VHDGGIHPRAALLGGLAWRHPIERKPPLARFSVDSDEVLTATSLVQGTVGRLESESTALMSQLTRLQGSWTGSAAIAFQGVVERWRATQRQVEESLADINGALAVAGREYADVEQASTSLFR